LIDWSFVLLDQSLSGLSNLERMRDSGGLAPLGKTLSFQLVDVGAGYAVFEGVPAEQHYNPAGTVHGGWIAAILDSALGCAVHSRLEAGQGYTTVELKTNMVRSLTAATGTVRATGTIIHLGRRVATSEARLEDASGRLLAHGSCTCMIL
jgi:uncharacterized protein (TIGR00369 family)